MAHLAHLATCGQCAYACECSWLQSGPPPRATTGDGRLYAEPVEPNDPLWAFVRARVEVESSGDSSTSSSVNQGSVGKLHMLCCLRLFRVAASHGSVSVSTTSPVGVVRNLSFSGAAASNYRGTWYWHCAQLPELLQSAAKYAHAQTVIST